VLKKTVKDDEPGFDQQVIKLPALASLQNRATIRFVSSIGSGEMDPSLGKQELARRSRSRSENESDNEQKEARQGQHTNTEVSYLNHHRSKIFPALNLESGREKEVSSANCEKAP
jgi:hypothetical protein